MKFYLSLGFLATVMLFGCPSLAQNNDQTNLTENHFSAIPTSFSASDSANIKSEVCIQKFSNSQNIFLTREIGSTPSFGRSLGKIVGAVVVGGSTLIATGVALYENNDNNPSAVYLLGVGTAIGIAAGIHWVGLMGGERGTYGSAFLGALISCTASAILLRADADKNGVASEGTLKAIIPISIFLPLFTHNSSSRRNS